MDARKEPIFSAGGAFPEVDSGPDERRYQSDRGSRNDLALWIVPILSLLILSSGYWAWTQLNSPRATPATRPAVAAQGPVAPRTSEPAIKYPIDAASADALPPSDRIDAYIAEALTKLLGQQAVASMLRIDSFARRVVVTVDNLDREHMASGLWPVNPTPGRFSVTGSISAQTVHPENSARYLPFVRLVESVDINAVFALYIRLYPVFQRAYEELGYPGQYFNDRLVAVVDNLLAAPEPSGPVAMKFTEVKGPIRATRPWLSYEFADPGLQALPSGQKLLIRMGAGNEKRIKKRLSELRHLLTTR
jgi:hypothetical protein